MYLIAVVLRALLGILRNEARVRESESTAKPSFDVLTTHVKLTEAYLLTAKVLATASRRLRLLLIFPTRGLRSHHRPTESTIGACM